MVEITLNPETPSQAIVNAANATFTVTDGLGRKIAVRRLKTLDRMRLLELVGAENSNNERYFGYAALAYSVVSIDGETVPVLASKPQLEGLVQRLDDEGFEAVAKAVSENFSQKTDHEAKDAVKNG